MAIEMTSEQIDAYRAKAVDDILKAIMPLNAEHDGEAVSLLPLEVALECLGTAAAWIVATSGHFHTRSARREVLEGMNKEAVRISHLLADNPDAAGQNLLKVIDKGIVDLSGRGRPS